MTNHMATLLDVTLIVVPPALFVAHCSVHDMPVCGAGFTSCVPVPALAVTVPEHEVGNGAALETAESPPSAFTNA